jgi:phospholipid/cholesterol/gamma-HCH transport system substrate-binding protein
MGPGEETHNKQKATSAMETKVNYTLVGAFVLILFTAGILGVIWLSSGFSFKSNSDYAIYMSESVAGLSIDSPVEYNGVNVGGVKLIEIDPHNPQLVQIVISIQSTTPITTGTAATLNARGVTGMTYLALKDNGQNLQPLVATKGQDYPIIKTSPSIFTRLDTALSQLSTSLLDITKTFQRVFDDQNRDAIQKTLQNLQTVTSTLSANTSKLSSIIKNTNNASQQMEPLLLSGSRTMQNLNDMSRNLADVSTQIRNDPAVVVRGNSSIHWGPGETYDSQ